MKIYPLLFLSIFILLPSTPLHSQEMVNEKFEGHLRQCKRFIQEKLSSKKQISFDSKNTYGLDLYITCTNQEIIDNLDTEETKFINELKVSLENWKDELSEKELQGVIALEKFNNTYWNNVLAYNKLEDFSDLSKEEIKVLDKQLKIIWHNMTKALAENNFELASSFFHESTKENYKKSFEQLPKDFRIKMLNEDQIAFDYGLGPNVIYHLVTERDGERYSYQLTFVKNNQGVWKIVSF